jgi:hypothetical protein
MMALGRIFDRDPRCHGVYRLLQLAESHIGIFSKASLEKRKRRQGGTVDTWINDFMRDVYVPTSQDFRRLRKYVDEKRVGYGKYRTLRDKHFAHKERVSATGLFANTSVRELQQLLVFLSRLQDALWDLFHNGLKPSLRKARYSTKEIVRIPEGQHRRSADQEWITQEVKKFLNSLVQVSCK